MKGLTFKQVQRLSRVTTAVTLGVIVAVMACVFSEQKLRADVPAVGEAVAGEAVASGNETLVAEAAPKAEEAAQAAALEPAHEIKDEPKEPESVSDDMAVVAILKDAGRSMYDDYYGPMPDDGCRPLRTRRLERGMETFCDTNALHLQAAVPKGIEPIRGVKSAWHLRHPIVKVSSTKDYYIDTLHHSLPYLIPEARKLLADIGRSFRDTLTARGGGDYRIKVTSLLRTPATVADLHKKNRNSVDSSAHVYGTTFDISYCKFICDSPSNPRTSNDLKLLLMEILDNLRSQGRCYVKSERKQSCFHITVR